MAIVNRSFSVYIAPGMMPPIVHVSEYDVGRAYTVSILDEQGNTFTIPSGTTASIEGTLNGSVGFTQSATISNNQVSFTLSESMTAYSGKAWCKIKLTQNSQPIQTCAFVLAVDRAGVEAETVIGADGFETQIQNAVDNYLDEHPVGVEVDPTLTISGKAADAKVTGDKIAELKSDFNTIATVGGTSAQMVDSSKYVDGYRWETASDSDIDADPVADSGWTIVNQQFFVDGGTTIGINTNTEIIILTYRYDSTTGKYFRFEFIQGSSFSVSGDHYAYTFSGVVKAFKVYISTNSLNNLSRKLIIAINSDWDGNPNYGQVSDAKLNPNVEIPQMNSFESNIEAQIKALQALDLGTLEDGYINSASGRAMDATSYKRTGFIHVQAEKLKVAITFAVASVGFAFYDSRKKYISGFDYTGYAVGDMRDVDVPENAYYFRYCALNANVDKMLVLVPNYADAVSRVDENPCFYALSSECRTFKKILCIGDSLTAGQFDYKENGVIKEFNDPDYSYPAFLKAITGRETTNAGDAGETTVSWYELHQNDDLSGHDACIIMLGRNDYASGRDTTSEQRSAAFANIIAKVRAENPQIKVFLSTLINYYTGSAADAINADIRAAATANGCYLLDISAYGRMVLSDDAYSHCTAEGYCTLAEYFFRYISYIMHNNYTDFKTIQFTGTNRAF